MGINAQLRAAALRIGRADPNRTGITSWTATTPATALGGTPVSAGTVTGYAVHGQLAGLGIASPGALVGPAKWYFTEAVLGSVSSGMQLASGAYTFEVVSEAAAGLGVYELKRIGVSK